MSNTVAEFDAHQALMTTAFEAVEPKSDWRGEIDATLTLDEIDALGGLPTIREAVEHFTATSPVMTHGLGNVRVQAAGYRAGPAA